MHKSSWQVTPTVTSSQTFSNTHTMSGGAYLRSERHWARLSFCEFLLHQGPSVSLHTRDFYCAARMEISVFVGDGVTDPLAGSAFTALKEVGRARKANGNAKQNCMSDSFRNHSKGAVAR